MPYDSLMDAQRFAKPRLDVGLVTDDPAMIDFMAEEVGLGAPEQLRVSRTTMQHRFDRNGSVVKVNVAEVLDTDARSGFSELMLTSPTVEEPTILTGPDDIVVSFVPEGRKGVDDMAVLLRVPDLEASVDFFAHALQWEVDGAVVRFGQTQIVIEEDAGAPHAVPTSTRGWTYLTAQVRNCDAETAAAESRGATVTRAPHTHGDVARFSMVTDRFGNHVELSQRASLTGPLPAN